MPELSLLGQTSLRVCSAVPELEDPPDGSGVCLPAPPLSVRTCLGAIRNCGQRQAESDESRDEVELYVDAMDAENHSLPLLPLPAPWVRALYGSGAGVLAASSATGTVGTTVRGRATAMGAGSAASANRWGFLVVR